MIRELLTRHEGLRLKPYFDCCGKLLHECRCTAKGKATIGVGRNLEDVGLSAEEAMHLLDKDILRARAAAATFAWYPKLDPVRKDVVVSMVFNLGLQGFSEFKRLIFALAQRDYERAASEMLASRWASQVKSRAVELAAMMRTGVYQ